MSQQPPWESYSQEDHFPPHVQSHVPQYRDQPYYEPQQVPPQWQESRYQPPAPRRRRTWTLYAASGIALLAVSAGATVALLHHHSGAAARPLTCKQQYAAWKTGPAHAQAMTLKADGKALDAAGSSEDIKMILSSLKTIGADATALQAYPMPACADPKGYWPQVLADMKAAGDNADGASGLGGLLLAEAPLKKVQPLETKLNAELAKTAGIKPL